MKNPDFSKISWKEFERLCADLLVAEGFQIESEVSVDTSGFDLVAYEKFKSHRGESIQVKWKIQCKHYSKSGNNLGKDEVDKYIYSFENGRSNNEGLIFMIDTDCTEPAQRAIENYLDTHKDVFGVKVWNQRHISTLLQRHSNLLSRYNLSLPQLNLFENFSELSNYSEKKVLIISDQSIIAHNLTSVFRHFNFETTFIPFWNYNYPVRMDLFYNRIKSQDFELIICFLGDTFSYPLPHEMIDIILTNHYKGASILFFPFLAWSVSKGINAKLTDLLPVNLRLPAEISLEEYIRNYHEKSDFTFFLNFDSFAEDRFVEIAKTSTKHNLKIDLEQSISLKYSYEFLEPKSSSQTLLVDSNTNPVLVVNNKRESKIAYMNICTHNCFSTIPISSPIENNIEMSKIFNNIILWLLDKKAQ